MAVRPSADERSKNQSARAECPYRQAHCGRAGTERPGHEERGHAYQHPAGHEVGEIRQGQRDERGREQRVPPTLHAPLPYSGVGPLEKAPQATTATHAKRSRRTFEGSRRSDLTSRPLDLDPFTPCQPRPFWHARPRIRTEGSRGGPRSSPYLRG